MNEEIVNTDKNEERKTWLRNLTLSILIHLIFMSVIYYIISNDESKSKINPTSLFFEIDEYEVKQRDISEIIEKLNQDSPEEQNENNATISEGFLQFTDMTADTTELDQVYHENSLNLSIKYPRGWIFLDQKRKNKLDGVTFWAINSNLDPPPYIHLEVTDKYFFNPNRYKYKLELNEFTAYYNDPEELSGVVSQNFYIHSNRDEDFILKLMIDGVDSFKAFQPKFLGILKSFEFGNELF